MLDDPALSAYPRSLLVIGGAVLTALFLAFGRELVGLWQLVALAVLACAARAWTPRAALLYPLPVVWAAGGLLEWLAEYLLG